MNTTVKHPIAKLLKQKGYDAECEQFYSKYGSIESLKPYRDYEHLHSYSSQLVAYFDGKYNWNALNVEEGMIALKTAFSESDGFVNCECSAPTVDEVKWWLYKNHKIWIVVDYSLGHFSPVIKRQGQKAIPIKHWNFFPDPIEAYEAAIEYVLTHPTILSHATTK